MWRSTLASVALAAATFSGGLAAAGPAEAGWAGPWGEKPFWERDEPRHYAPKREPRPHVAPNSRAARKAARPAVASGDEDDDAPPVKRKHTAKAKPEPKAEAKELVQGGPRPAIAPKAPETVAFHGSYPVGSIVIDTAARKLYYVKAGGHAFRYPIAVGKAGFTWTGTEQISRKQPWPDWIPPEEMRERKPNLPERMTGGINNPLGAMALYLGNSLYRIHGTSDASSIGTASSSGCIRMHNAHVLHLASMAGVGTQVTVLKSLPSKVATAD